MRRNSCRKMGKRDCCSISLNLLSLFLTLRNVVAPVGREREMLILVERVCIDPYIIKGLGR